MKVAERYLQEVLQDGSYKEMAYMPRNVVRCAFFVLVAALLLAGCVLCVCMAAAPAGLSVEERWSGSFLFASATFFFVAVLGSWVYPYIFYPRQMREWEPLSRTGPGEGLVCVIQSFDALQECGEATDDDRRVFGLAAADLLRKAYVELGWFSDAKSRAAECRSARSDFSAHMRKFGFLPAGNVEETIEALLK